MVSGIKFDDAKNERTHYLRNSSNSPDCNVNGSGTPVNFDFTVQEGGRFYHQQLHVTIVDGGIKFGVFAGLAAALTNGCNLTIIRDGVTVFDYNNSTTFKTNEDLISIAGSFSDVEPGAGDDILTATFRDPFHMEGGDILRLTVNDDLSTVSYFRVTVHGRYW